MRRALVTVFASLLAVALIAPAAQGATQFRQVQSELTMWVVSPAPQPPHQVPAGRLTLDFVFKNTRSNRKKFTPRQLTRIAFESVPLSCSNAPVDPTGYSELLLTTTLETKIKLERVPHPDPKPGKYAFRFAYSFPAFTGTISGTIWKATNAPKPRTPMAHGVFDIEDLDAGPSQWNCWSLGGRRTWAGVPAAAP